MQVVRLMRIARGWKRRCDAAVVAACLTAIPAFGAGTFSTFLRENSSIVSVGHDASGNLYILVVGSDGSYTVTRLDAAATKAGYSAALSGSGCEQGSAMKVDGAGYAYIAGTSGGYPCVLKLAPTGQAAYSFVVESTVKARVLAIAVDADSSILITGDALAFGFPSVGGGFSAPDSSVSNLAVSQPFVARVDPGGKKLAATAVGVGGSQIAIGPQGDVLVAGNAAGIGVGDGPPNSYPVTPGAFQTTFAPSFDCTAWLCQLSFPSPEQYVTRLDAGLTRLVYSTYVTGSQGAGNSALVVDADGNAYLSGSSRSNDYPYTPGQPAGARPGLFLTKLDPAGSKLVWSVQQGGNLLGFDAAGKVILGGSAAPQAGLPYQIPVYPLPPPPPGGDIPPACLPNGLRVQTAAFVQRLSAEDGSVLATQQLAATRAQPSAMDVLGDGRVLVGGASTFPDVAITPGTIFTSAVAQRSVSGSFLAAFDLATASAGGQLACAADGLTNMPLGPLAPGQLITLFGNGLGPPQPVSASDAGPDPVPVSLGGVTVAFDGVAGPLTYVSDGQVNVGVPWEVAGKASTVMTVTVNANGVASRQFAVAASNPSLFVDTSGPPSDGNGLFPAIALNADGSRNSPDHPAQGGSWVTLFLNGASAYSGDTPPPTGSVTPPDPSPTGVAVTVTAGTSPLESGPLLPRAGALSGLYQVQVHLPVYPPGGRFAVPLTVTAGGVPAAPLVYFDKVYQAGGLVWVE
jgi:uncharacterized protein (TIGR03437 family)